MVFLWRASVVDILLANALTAGPSGWGLCSTGPSLVDVVVVVDPGVSWGRRADVIGGCVGFIVGTFSGSLRQGGQAVTVRV